MTAGTIFVLCLAAGFVMFILYLARLSRRTLEEEAETKRTQVARSPETVEEKSRLKRAS